MWRPARRGDCKIARTHVPPVEDDLLNHLHPGGQAERLLNRMLAPKPYRKTQSQPAPRATSPATGPQQVVRVQGWFDPLACRLGRQSTPSSQPLASIRVQEKTNGIGRGRRPRCARASPLRLRVWPSDRDPREPASDVPEATGANGHACSPTGQADPARSTDPTGDTPHAEARLHEGRHQPRIQLASTLLPRRGEPP